VRVDDEGTELQAACLAESRARLSLMPPAALRALLARPPEDALLGSYPVGPEEAQGLAPWLRHSIDRDRYVYLIEPAQEEGAENPAVVVGDDR